MKTKIIDAIIDREAGYVNDPSDSGGETNWGITKHTALLNGYSGEMVNMTRDQAFDIYSAIYTEVFGSYCINIWCINI